MAVVQLSAFKLEIKKKGCGWKCIKVATRGPNADDGALSPQTANFSWLRPYHSCLFPCSSQGKLKCQPDNLNRQGEGEQKHQEEAQLLGSFELQT